MSKKMLAVILLVISLFTLAACGESVINKVGDEQLQTLKLAGGTDWGAPSPYLHDPRGPGTAKMKLVFDSLLDADAQGDIPWLAKEWEIKGNAYTFTLSEQATFHDGQPVTTADVAFTLDYYQKFPPVTNYLDYNGHSIVASYQIIDEQTITLTVEQPLATTLVKLGSFVILPQHIWENVADPYTFNEAAAYIGSGPYTFGAYDPAVGSYEFIAYDNYYGHQPVAARVLFVPVSEPLLAFDHGEIDLTEVPIDALQQYQDDPTIGMLGKENDMGYKMLVNMEKLPEFKELELRIALYQALDRQEVVAKVFRGSGAVGSAGYVPPTNYFYSERVIQYDYQPTRAKKVLAKKNLNVELLVANSSDDLKIAELLKHDFEAAGMQIKVVALDAKIRDERILAGEYELAVVGNGGWSRTPDYLRTLYSSQAKYTGSNPHFMGARGHDNQIITSLAEAQLLELDFDKRQEIFADLQYEISKEVPIVVIATKTTQVIFKKDYYSGWVKTYDYQQVEQNRLSYVEK
ncbi:MAG TPA: ABC transporter substrate-binding protein [Oscillospiraceae bacterium]|nr:ABC transporter substrate-binding protein [Oscillospiraceae bacterium]